MEKRKLMDIGISIGEYGEFTEKIIELAGKKKGGYVCVANSHMIIEAHDDPEFARVVNNADIVTPDGMPLVILLRILYGKKQPRVAGMDILPDLILLAARMKLSVFFYGSTDKSLRKIIARASSEYPELIISGTIAPPFGNIPSEIIKEHFIEIREKDPDIIFVVLGCPKQEKLMAEMSGQVNGIMIGIGGAVPVFTREVKRAPAWMQKISLEWLFRLIQEPGRLWKRYFYTNSKFVFLAIKEVFSNKISKNRDSV